MTRKTRHEENVGDIRGDQDWEESSALQVCKCGVWRSEVRKERGLLQAKCQRFRRSQDDGD